LATATLEFEKPLVELEKQIDELKRLADDARSTCRRRSPARAASSRTCASRSIATSRRCSACQVRPLARRPLHPRLRRSLFTDWWSCTATAPSATTRDRRRAWRASTASRCLIIGHQRGRDTKENLRRNFGMPHPEGYRKALRLMKLAEKFQVPVLTFIDTPGAWAGPRRRGARPERGHRAQPARDERPEVPIVATVIGEGGSGRRPGARRGRPGADARERGLFGDHGRGVRCDPVEGRQEPRDARARRRALKITAPDLYELRVIDEIVPEPAGGAHADHEATAHALKASLTRNLDELRKLKPEKLVRRRREKFLKMGRFVG
jgi:acetyl-CoA carboxylase carboxyl transferase subunit alpha